MVALCVAVAAWRGTSPRLLAVLVKYEPLGRDCQRAIAVWHVSSMDRIRGKHGEAIRIRSWLNGPHRDILPVGVMP
jgi:hypothetical protein